MSTPEQPDALPEGPHTPSAQPENPERTRWVQFTRGFYRDSLAKLMETRRLPQPSPIIPHQLLLLVEHIQQGAQRDNVDLSDIDQTDKEQQDFHDLQHHILERFLADVAYSIQRRVSTPDVIFRDAWQALDLLGKTFDVTAIAQNLRSLEEDIRQRKSETGMQGHTNPALAQRDAEIAKRIKRS